MQRALSSVPECRWNGDLAPDGVWGAAALSTRDGKNVVGLRRRKPTAAQPEARPTQFYFYGEPEFVATLSDVLVRRGFATRPTPEHSGLVATIRLGTNSAAFTNTANWLAGVAGDLGIEFDGWDTDPAPDTH